MNRLETTGRRIAGLLLLTSWKTTMKPRTGCGAIAIGFLLVAATGTEHCATAAEAAALVDQTWTWGYVIQGPLPGRVPFISASGSPPFDGVSSCSLETGARFIGTPNVVFMNSNHNRNTLTS